ncbi:MAG TPA: tetratricopeptide repeat protein, partial [Spirochaetota bacterium]|nr:tetratricopeptide repeat protein [Spirochaetota bacterium]
MRLWTLYASLILTGCAILACSSGTGLKAERPDDGGYALLSARLQALVRDGYYREAAEIGKKIIPLAEARFGTRHEETLRSMTLAGLALRKNGEYAEAEAILLAANSNAMALWGKKHVGLVEIRNSMAELYLAYGKMDAAAKYADQAWTGAEDWRTIDPLKYAEALKTAGLVQYHLGEYDRALAFYKSAYQIRLTNLGANHLLTAESLNNLAVVHTLKGDYTNGLAKYQRSLAIRTNLLSPGHPDIAQSWNNLASFHFFHGAYDEALQYYLKAYELWKERLGLLHPETGTCLNNLAEIYKRQKNWDKAEEYYKQAIKIFEATPGRQHFLLSTVLHNLATLYDTQGNLASAEH